MPARSPSRLRRSLGLVSRGRIRMAGTALVLVVAASLPGARAQSQSTTSTVASSGAATTPSDELRTHTEAAREATARGDLVAAETSYRAALAIADRRADSAAQATVLRSLGLLADRRGLTQQSVDLASRAVAAADRAGDAALRVRTRGGLAGALLAVSRYDDALATTEASHDISAASGDPGLRAAALFDAAQANAHVWNLDRAAALWTDAIAAHRQTNNTVMLALDLKQSTETWFALGDFDRAAAAGIEAIELLRQTKQAHYVAETAARVSLSEMRRGRPDEARTWAARARADLAATPLSRQLFVHNDLGIVGVELGEVGQARSDFERVRRVADEVGNVEYQWRASWGFGRVALSERPAEAVPDLERATALVDRLRQTIPEAGLRASFMTNRVGPYETLVEAHMASASAPDDAATRRGLEVAERARGRALADLLAESRARLSDPRLAALRDEEVAFGRRFTDVQKQIASATDPPARSAAQAALRDLEREYETLVVRIRRDTPGYAALAFPPAPAASDLAAMLAPDEALVETFLSDKGGFVWVVRQGTLRGYRVPGNTALDSQIRLLTALLAARDEPGVRQLAARLYDSLLGPADDLLRDTRRLVVVADGVLQRLPFALLRSRERWLVDTYVIAYAPSASILGFLRANRSARAPETLLALAASDPSRGHAAIFDHGVEGLDPIPSVLDEVDRARRRLGANRSSVRTGAAATEQTLKSPDAARYRVLHLAAHAVADEIVPRRSAVLLTPSGEDDGLLQASEIANLTLNADLVVLAACRSHVGRLVRGEGLLSLSRAFIHAGAKAVVATAWTVPDRETTWLMDRFYAAVADGLAPDAALQRAQRDAIASGGRRADPDVWGAFVIVGDAGQPVFDAPVETRTVWSASLAAAGVVLFGGAVAFARRRGRGAKREPHTRA